MAPLTVIVVPVFGTSTPVQPGWYRPWCVAGAACVSQLDHQVLVSSNVGTAFCDGMVAATLLLCNVIASVCSVPKVESYDRIRWPHQVTVRASARTSGARRPGA